MKTIEDYNTLVKTYIDTKDSAKAPTDHSSTATTYGVGSTTKYGHVKVDDALSSTSTNPVQNKKVYELKQALSDEVETRAKLGAHNLAVGEFSVYSSYGVTFTPQADGSVIAYSANAPSDAVACSSSVFTLKAGSYVLGKNLGERENVQLLKASDNSSIAFANLGNDVPFTLNADTEVKIVLYAYSAHGAYNNVVYKPFIRLASDAITEWSSPVPTNAQLLSYKDNGVLGAKNLLKLNYDNGYSDVIGTNGTLAVNDDGSITIESQSAVTAVDYKIADYVYLPAGNYIISGVPSGASAQTYGLWYAVWKSDNSGYLSSGYLYDDIEITLPYRARVTLYLEVTAGYTIGTKTFKPMIRLASDTDATYQPYAMTNRELMEYTTRNNLATAINISSYNSENNLYVAPSDGYVSMNYSTTSQVNERTLLVIYSSDDTNHFYHANNAVSYLGANMFASSVFVRKGMRMFVNVAEHSIVSFVPLA